MNFIVRALPCAAAVLVPAAALAHGISEEDKAAMLAGDYLQYALLGAKHMLAGYEHLLFLFGVILFLTHFADVAEFVTAFTLGHTITLISATFLGYHLELLARGRCDRDHRDLQGFRHQRRLPATSGHEVPQSADGVFILGLIHGFGLSTGLQQLPLGEDKGEMLGRILSFNAGVELGQIASLTVMLVLLAVWRRRPGFRKFSVAASADVHRRSSSSMKTWN